MPYILPYASFHTPPNGEYGNRAAFRDNPHMGTDGNCPTGTALQATIGGRWIRSGWSAALGYFVVWLGDDGLYWSYSHLIRPATIRGRIDQGDVIAISGATGDVTGPHVHVAVNDGPAIGGSPHDPMLYLPNLTPATSNTQPLDRNDMADISAAQMEEIAQRVWTHALSNGTTSGRATDWLTNMSDDTADREATAQAVWTHDLSNNQTPPTHGRAADWLLNMSDRVGFVTVNADQLAAQLAPLLKDSALDETRIAAEVIAQITAQLSK